MNYVEMGSSVYDMKPRQSWNWTDLLETRTDPKCTMRKLKIEGMEKLMLFFFFLIRREGRFPSVGRLRRPSSTGSSPQPATSGATASSCGK